VDTSVDLNNQRWGRLAIMKHVKKYLQNEDANSY